MSGGRTMVGCTVVTRGYVPFARLVARTWLDQHPGSRFTILVVDPEAGTAPRWTHRSVEVISPSGAGLPSDERLRMAAMYDPGELACALKPWALRHALEHADAAVYLDADVEVLAPMTELGDLARRHGLVLCPHTLEPVPDDGRLPDAFTMLRSGAFNGGLVAVGRTGRGFLDWWAAQLARHCINEPAEGLLADQRWLDLAPAYFEHHIVRDPTYDVAYWNLHERATSWDGERLLVGGRPARCFHYSGLTDAAPWSLSRFMGDRPRLELRDEPAVARLCRRYLDQLRSLDADGDRSIPYAFAATASGLRVDRRARRLYRQALLDAEADIERSGEPGHAPAALLPPGPFAEDGGTAFLDWLLEVPAGEHLARYHRRVWDESAVLQRQFPSAPTDPTGAAELRRWIAHLGPAQAGVPDALLPEPEEADMTDLPEELAFRNRPLRPDVRSQQALPELDAARAAVERGRVADRLPAGARRAVDRLLRNRDRHHDEIAAHLVAALSELSTRVALLGQKLNAFGDALPEHANRVDEVAAEVHEVHALHEVHVADVAASLHRLELALGEERTRIDGALEQDTITGSIVVDAEQRLTDEVAELRRRVDKLLADLGPDPAGSDRPPPDRG
ncbi:MAG: hypothetical protein HYX34_03115 [Actinobacteria bacterium]|nr:hypothetical protein [Actinomycetota bacterium]